MKKKTAKKKKPVKQKIDVVLESLLNLERKMKELIAQVEQLRYSQSRFKDVEIDPNKYWPNIPERDDKLSWNYSKPIVGYDSCTGQPIRMDSWNNKNKQ